MCVHMQLFTVFVCAIGGKTGSGKSEERLPCGERKHIFQKPWFFFLNLKYLNSSTRLTVWYFSSWSIRYKEVGCKEELYAPVGRAHSVIVRNTVPPRCLFLSWFRVWRNRISHCHSSMIHWRLVHGLSSPWMSTSELSLLRMRWDKPCACFHLIISIVILEEENCIPSTGSHRRVRSQRTERGSQHRCEMNVPWIPAQGGTGFSLRGQVPNDLK